MSQREIVFRVRPRKEGLGLDVIRVRKTGELNLLGLKKYSIEEFEEFKKIILNANEKRFVSTTKLNSESSQSHR